MAENRYIISNTAALQDEEGVLMTASCDHQVSRSEYGEIITIAGRERELVPQTSQVHVPETETEGEVIARLELTGETSREAAEVKVEGARINAGNVTLGAIRAEAMVEEEREIVHRAIEVTDDGEVTLREYVRTERVFYRHVFEIFYFAAINEPEEPPEPSRKEKCVDCCCQTFSCNFSGMTQKLIKRRHKRLRELKSEFKKVDYMTPVLRRGRAKGWIIHTKMIFPLVNNAFRNVWVGGELLIVLIALGLSIVSFSLSENRIFNILHLALTILGSILAIIDGMILLNRCSLSKQCGADRKHASDKGESVKEELPDQHDPEVISSHRCGERCIATTQNIFDIIRMIISELIFFPLLICDILEVITTQAYLFSNVADGISFSLVIVSLVLLFLFVYLVRIIVIVAANYHSQKKRRRVAQDRSNSKSALYFQVYFIFHVIAQMVVQILMIIAIGVAIYNDNEHLFSEGGSGINDMQISGGGSGINDVQNDSASLFSGGGSGFDDVQNIVKKDDNSSSNSTVELDIMKTVESDESIHISIRLWYMLVAGYILPICGLLTFFIVTYFWVQEFPIGICVDFLSILKLRGIDEALELKKTGEELGEKINKINKYIHLSELKQQFKDLQDTAWRSKFIYPFKSPQMAILCLIYALLLSGFVICAGAFGDNPGGYWSGFYLFGLLAVFLANLYVFTVAMVWSVIIMGVFIVIALIVGAIAVIVALIVSLITTLISNPPLLCCCIFCVCLGIKCCKTE